MTTPKEALEQIAARSIAQDDDDEKELRRQLYHIEALAKGREIGDGVGSYLRFVYGSRRRTCDCALCRQGSLRASDHGCSNGPSNRTQ